MDIPEDYPEFHHYEDLHWCMDMLIQASFLYMGNADVLIKSKSCFSYNLALLNCGQNCLRNFWYGYPDA